MTLPFCERCIEAKTAQSSTVNVSRKIKGETITLDVDIDLCQLCNDNPRKLTRELRRLFNDAYRANHDLVTTYEIKKIRQEFKLNQRDFARLIGLGEISVARYESGFIPSKANSLRIRQLNNLDQLKTYYKDTKAALSKKAIANIDAYIASYVSIENGNRMYESERFFALTAHFVEMANENGITMYVTKLNKFMFYADFLAFKHLKQSLTGSRYVRLSFGPVPNRYDFKYDMNPYITTVVKNDKITYHRTKQKIPKILSPAEYNLVVKVFSLLRTMRSSEVSEMSHNEQAWIQTAPGRYVSYTHAHDLLIDPVGNTNG